MIPNGIFITFEGGEGCGKTTQISLLAKYLQEEGFNVLTTREPGGTGCYLAESIRAMLLNPEHAGMSAKTELLLFCAARAQHIHDVIAPALARGQIVLCDRLFDSTWAYQHYTRGIVTNAVFWKFTCYAVTYNDWAYYPDITYMLDIPVEIGHARALLRNKRGNDQSEARFDNEALTFHTKVNQGYRELAQQWPRIRTIDANRTIDEIQLDLRKQTMEYSVAFFKRLAVKAPLHIQEFPS